MRFKIINNSTKKTRIIDSEKLKKFEFDEEKDELCPKCGKSLEDCTCVTEEHIDDATKKDKELSEEEIQILKEFIPLIPDLLKLAKSEDAKEEVDVDEEVEKDEVDVDEAIEDEEKNKGIVMEESSEKVEADEVDEDEDAEDGLTDEEIEDEEDIALEDSVEEIEQNNDVLNESDDEEDIDDSFDKFYKNQLRK